MPLEPLIEGQLRLGRVVALCLLPALPRAADTDHQGGVLC